MDADQTLREPGDIEQPLTRKFVNPSSMKVFRTKSSSAMGGRGCCCPAGSGLGTEDPVWADWAAAVAANVP